MIDQGPPSAEFVRAATEGILQLWSAIGYWFLGLVALFIVCRWSPFRRKAAPKEEE